MDDCRTRIRSVDVYDGPGSPVRLTLDAPEVASRWAGWSFAVTGSLRAAAKSAPITCIRVAAVSTILDEIALESTPSAGVYRFGALVSTFGLAPLNEIFLHVSFEGGGHFTACRIEVECDLPAPPASGYTPILINALPRSGTTWLASLLAQHPQVVAYPRYPFELRQAIYWASLLRILTNPYNNHRERREMRFLVDRDVRGGSPYYTNFLDDLVPWHATAYGEELVMFARTLIEKFYRNVEAIGAAGKTGVRHFVEKFPGRVPPLTMRWLFPQVRELYLVREPADIFRSIFCFNRKRGYPDFGEETLGRTEALFRHVALENQEDLTFFEQRCGAEAAIVRYEDLAADTRGTLSRLLERFDMDRSDRTLQAMLDGAAAMHVPEHATGGSAAAEGGLALTAREEAWIANYFADFRRRFYPR